MKSFAKLRWGASTFSPVDHKIVDQNGIEWYILKNGDQLTTVHAKGTSGDEEVWRDI